MSTETETASLPATVESEQANRSVVGWVPLAGWLVGLPIAYLLLSTAIVHISNPYRFLSSIESYTLVPIFVAELAAWFLPFFHIALGISLISGPCQRSAAGLGCCLFSLYAVAQATTLMRGLEVDCGCFGTSQPSPIGAQSIGLAAICALASLFAWWAIPPRSSDLVDSPAAVTSDE